MFLLHDLQQQVDPELGSSLEELATLGIRFRSAGLSTRRQSERLVQSVGANNRRDTPDCIAGLENG